MPLIIARPLGVNIIIINNFKTSIKPSFSEKNVLLTLVLYMNIICGYQTSCHQEIWQKNLIRGKNSCLFDVVHQCIVALDTM